MAIPMNRLGGRAFKRADNDDDETEREYDRLRDLARAEAEKRNSCYDRSQEAYRSGDGGAAKALSNEGKQHASRMDDYNRQASEFIFRANNAPGEVDEDEIDLHGQHVDEAEQILAQRVRADKDRGISHLYAIVGKGNHSARGVQKLKPAVEKLCRELGLNYATDEENTGRILINLQGGEAVMPPQGQHHGQQQQHHGQQQHYGQGQSQHGGQQQHHGQQQQYGGHQQQQNHQNQQQQHQQQDEGADLLVKLVRKLEKSCCMVM
ncbi:smr domain-containing protein [Plectosphaerella plurivora]|uniref:Smr domain-containing protein n=1 Tax=Plectosphaerella plurivora TaxID=936078 RepID=A0A9P8VIJ6_9PEZI|nr:smr domain-containing protein [Plectosphaerella plurivora]